MSVTITRGLYNPARGHDACGFGFVARVDGRRSRETVEEGLEVLLNLDHRGASLLRCVARRTGGTLG